jgi:hypothetical protein
VCGAFGLWRRYDSFLRPEAANCNQRIKRRGTALHYDRTIGKGWLANPASGTASASLLRPEKGKNGGEKVDGTTNIYTDTTNGRDRQAFSG